MLNSNVKFTGTDESGPFSHVGKCIAINGADITMTSEYGEMVVPITDVVKTREARSKREIEAPETIKATVRAGSKADQVQRLVAANPLLTRKEMMAKIVADIGMTPAGASTYFSNAKRNLA